MFVVPSYGFAPIRLGPPPRSFAADAHACIMVRVTAAHRIQGCGASSSRPTASSPRMRHPDHNQRAAVLWSVKARPGNDGACGEARATDGTHKPARLAH